MTTNTDPVRALLAPKLDMIISGYRINQDDADWLRGLLHRAAAPPSAPVGVEWVLELADEYDTKGQHERAHYLRTLAQQPAAPSDWVLVPRTPTLAMANAAWRELESQGIDPEDVETPQVWGAMLAAAPQQPAGVDEDIRLWDLQWVNVVNAPEVLNADSVEDAVNAAVRLTEQAMAKNHANGNWPKNNTRPDAAQQQGGTP